MSIIELSGKKWRTRREMAEHLGVSERTVTRRVDSGAIVRRETASGNYYLLETELSRDMRDTSEPSRDSSHIRRAPHHEMHETPTETGQLQPTETHRLLSALLDAQARIAELERIAGRADVLGALVENQAEIIEDLQDELAEVRSLSESRLIESVSWRARAHVAEGRLDMLQDDS